MAKTKEQLLNILDQFQLDEKVVSAEPFGNGHINDTLKVTNEKGEIKYVLQRINHLIFTNVDMLQNNIHVVTTHIRKKLEEKGETDIDRKVLTFLPTKDGKKYYFDGDSYWRVYRTTWSGNHRTLCQPHKKAQELLPHSFCCEG